MSTESDAKRKAAAAYNAAADCYDHPALSFWEQFGRRTVERLALRPGLEVLDACCGSGASALPAAEAVAPGGRVLAVDLADRLVELGRRKSRIRGLDNLEFRVADVEALKLPDASFDAVVCVFGIFFLPDMAKAVRELWRMVRVGGRLAITTWGANFFEPANTVFWESVHREQPELFKAFHPWDRINESILVERLLEEGGAKPMEVAAEFAPPPRLAGGLVEHRPGLGLPGNGGADASGGPGAGPPGQPELPARARRALHPGQRHLRDRDQDRAVLKMP